LFEALLPGLAWLGFLRSHLRLIDRVLHGFQGIIHRLGISFDNPLVTRYASAQRPARRDICFYFFAPTCRRYAGAALSQLLHSVATGSLSFPSNAARSVCQASVAHFTLTG